MTEHLLDGILARALVLLGLALLAGPAALRLAGLGPARRQAGATGAVMVLAGAGLSLGGGTYTIAGRLSPEVLFAVATGTSYGRTLLLQGLLLAVLVALALGHRGSDRRRGAAVLGLALLVVVSLGRSGHPGARAEAGLALAHAVHTAAALTWTAGLLWLQEAGSSVAPAAIGRFSRIALFVVGIAIASGLALAAGLGGAWPFRSSWGHALVAKLALLSVSLVIAAGHRRRRLPALRSAPEASEQRAAFARAVALELAVVLSVLLLASALSQLAPPA